MWSSFALGPTLPQSSRKRKDRQPGRTLRSHQHAPMSRESLHQGRQKNFNPLNTYQVFFQDSVKNKEYTGSCSKLLVQYKAAFKQVGKVLFFLILWKSGRIPLEIFFTKVQGDEFPTVESFMAKYRLDAPAALERIKVTLRKTTLILNCQFAGGQTDYDQRRQGQHFEADRRDCCTLHHCDGQVEAGHQVHGRLARWVEGKQGQELDRLAGNWAWVGHSVIIEIFNLGPDRCSRLVFLFDDGNYYSRT